MKLSKKQQAAVLAAALVLVAAGRRNSRFPPDREGLPQAGILPVR